MIRYSALSPEHKEAYKTLRLKAVNEAPHAFSESPEEITAITTQSFQVILDKNTVFGTFKDEALIGIASYYVHPQKKYCHRALLHGVYLLPEYRGQRDEGDLTIARMMMQVLIQHAGAKVEHLELSVESNSDAALAFYKKLGFEAYGRFPKLSKLADGSYIDDIYMWLDTTNA